MFPVNPSTLSTLLYSISIASTLGFGVAGVLGLACSVDAELSDSLLVELCSSPLSPLCSPSVLSVVSCFFFLILNAG